MEPLKVVLFSGHMMDQPDRSPPRFPPEMEEAATVRIHAALDKLKLDWQDLALSQAAAGGDLIFLEACQRREVPCQIMLPFNEATFLQKSVMPSIQGASWCRRYFAVKDRLQLPVRIMPDDLDIDPLGVSPYERCNLWLLDTALSFGPEKVSLITLWDGGGGDGPGGTSHMYDEVRRLTGRVSWIDTRRLEL